MDGDIMAEQEHPPDQEGEKASAPFDKAPITLDLLRTYHIVEMAKDRQKSRELQRCIYSSGFEVASFICDAVELHFGELVRDQFGNYLAQRVLQVCSDEAFGRLLDFSLAQDFARDQFACRVLQRVVEEAVPRGKIHDVLAAFPLEDSPALARHISGFNVVCKLVQCLPVVPAEDLIKKLCGTTEELSALAKDSRGCCVLKKCIGRAEGSCREILIDSLVGCILELVKDPFGNYAVQHAVIHGPEGTTTNPYSGRVVDALKGHVFELAQDKFSSPVLEKCLMSAADGDKNKIINEILNPPSCPPSEAMRTLLFHQYGNYVVQQALDVAREPQLSLLLGHVRGPFQDFWASHGSGGAASAELPEDKLSPELSHRLCLKLLKKFPVLATSSDVGAGDGWDGYPGGQFGDGALDESVWAGDPTQMYDPYWGLPLSYPPWATAGAEGHGCKARRSGARNRRRSRARASEATNGHADHDFAAGKTIQIGRVVGYWPNYTVEYDEVEFPPGFPAPSTRAQKRGTSDGTKRKARVQWDVAAS